jgi:endonuclease/exonuclease/phosphatase family metal-dependent hydrolase
MESLYNYYREYGNVMIAGDFNSISSLHTNVNKHNIFSSFVNRYGISVPTIDFDFCGETFTCSKRMLDYISFHQCLTNNLAVYRLFEESFLSSTSDHLPVFVELKFNRSSPFLVRLNLTITSMA